MQELLLPIITSFIIVILATPSFIKVAIYKRLFDTPDGNRKLHVRNIPSMGGIMIFAGTLFAFSLWYPSETTREFNYLIPCMLILFFVGMKDDIIGTTPAKKLLSHLVVAFIMVLMANIKITSLHGLFGIREIPEYAGVFLSVFTYIVVVNAFNLIDGIDGLAATVGLVASCVFGVWFYFAEDMVFSVLAFSLAGALFAFLFFNFAPAKIFMGDSGSLTIGFIVSVLAIEMVEFDKEALPNNIYNISRPVLSMSVLVYPLMDTLRIFIYRSLKGVSPFSADKNHIHHQLLRLGMNHKQVVACVFTYNILIISLTVLLQDIEPSITFSVVILAAILLAQFPFFFKVKKA